MGLCFGTFTKILTLCTEISARELVEKITLTIDENSEFRKKEVRINTAVNRLLNCSAEPSREIRELARKAKKMDVLSKFESIVVPIMYDKLKAQTVLALLDIIEKDTVIDADNGKIFESYIGVKKSDLRKKKEFILDDFLSGILLYTLNATRNRDGAVCGRSNNCIEKKNSDKICDDKHMCVRGIDKKHLEKFHERKDTITIWDSIAQRDEQIRAKAAASQYESPSLQMYKKYMAAVGDYHFWDYIKSEPLEMYLVNSEAEKYALEELYLKYELHMADTIQSQFGAYSGLDHLTNSAYISDDLQDEKLPDYSNRRLEANVLSICECFVKYINREIIVTFIDDEEEKIYKDINIFKKKLNEYNRYLRKYLEADDNYLVLKDEFIESKHEDIQSSEIKWRMMGFHSTTRRFRSELCFLYKRVSYNNEVI